MSKLPPRLTQGFYPQMMIETYQSDPAPEPSLNQSGITDLIDRSPYHFAFGQPRLNPYTRPRESTKAQLLGETVHGIALRRGRPISIIHYQDYSSGSAREARDLALANGRIPVLEWMHDKATYLAKIVRNTIDEVCGGEPYQTEVPFFWLEPTEFGDIWCRGCLDVWCEPKGLILDPKVLRIPAVPGAFGKTAGDSGYDIQREFYVRGVETLLPELAGRVSFKNLPIESSAPHGYALMEPDGETQAAAKLDVNLAINKFAECMAKRSWPSYPPQSQIYSTPHYRQQRSLERALSFQG